MVTDTNPSVTGSSPTPAPTTRRPRVTFVYVPAPPDLTRIKPGPATDRAAAAIRELGRPQLKKQQATEGGAA